MVTELYNDSQECTILFMLCTLQNRRRSHHQGWSILVDAGNATKKNSHHINPQTCESCGGDVAFSWTGIQIHCQEFTGQKSYMQTEDKVKWQVLIIQADPGRQKKTANRYKGLII